MRLKAKCLEKIGSVSQLVPRVRILRGPPSPASLLPSLPPPQPSPAYPSGKELLLLVGEEGWVLLVSGCGGVGD